MKILVTKYRKKVINDDISEMFYNKSSNLS